MAEKKFRLRREDIKPLVTGYGGCIASDMITVDGYPVGFMYRERVEMRPDRPDSGWRFLAGAESDGYMNDASKHAVYDVNTIANYDPAIIPLLDSPPGSVFERTPQSERFEAVIDWVPPEEAD